MGKTKKILSILLVFLLSIGVCCNFKVFAQGSDLSEQEEYNQKIKEDLGLDENPTEKNPQELEDFLLKLCLTNMEKKGWFSVNGYSDLMSLDIYGVHNDVNIKQNPNKKYTVEYSEIDGFIRSFTIDELEYEYSGVMPTDDTFGIPIETSEEWNSDIQKDIPQSPAEVSGKVVKGLVNNISFMNLFLTENHPTWGLTINGKMSQEDLENIANSIKNDANYKVEYTMDNGYIRNFTIEEITSQAPTPVPSETEQEETPSNPTENTTDTQNRESNKQHILDDEPKTGL